jgi:hypothetical protein
MVSLSYIWLIAVLNVFTGEFFLFPLLSFNLWDFVIIEDIFHLLTSVQSSSAYNLRNDFSEVIFDLYFLFSCGLLDWSFPLHSNTSRNVKRKIFIEVSRKMILEMRSFDEPFSIPNFLTLLNAFYLTLIFSSFRLNQSLPLVY